MRALLLALIAAAAFGQDPTPVFGGAVQTATGARAIDFIMTNPESQPR